MSGTAPSDPAPGGHPGDRGVQQTRLDGNQHGQTQNIIDETKNNAGPTAVDRNIGDAIDASNARGAPSSRVDDILNEPGAPSESVGAERKGAMREEQGFRVGDEGDKHDLAVGKQP